MEKLKIAVFLNWKKKKKKKQKSFINRVVTSVKKTIKRKGLYSKSSNKLKKLKLSSDTAAGKNKQVLKRKMTMRRKKR